MALLFKKMKIIKLSYLKHNFDTIYVYNDFIVTKEENIMIFIWIIIGLFIYYMHKSNTSDCVNSKKTYSSMEVLKQRYVKGEIDDETFDKMKKIIHE